MGSSARKKREKKKDFQKAKLKVGKTKAKPANFTDTSFKAKSIVVGHQSISSAAPDHDAKFSHYLSVLNHHSPSHRRDALVHLTDSIASRPVDGPLPVPMPVLLPKVLPLIVDQASSVRSQVLSLLSALPPTEVSGHVTKIVLFIHSAMTHLAADVRNDSTRFLSWLLEVAGDELVSTAQGWLKTTKCFLALFGWDSGSKSGLGQPNFQKLGSDTKSTIKHLQVLRQFLNIGLTVHSPDQDSDGEDSYVTLAKVNRDYPVTLIRPHLLPTESNCYSYLSLFGSTDIGSTGPQLTDEVSSRQTSLSELFPVLLKGAQALVKEEGEIGRNAQLAATALETGMARGNTELDGP